MRRLSRFVTHIARLIGTPAIALATPADTKVLSIPSSNCFFLSVLVLSVRSNRFSRHSKEESQSTQDKGRAGCRQNS